MRFKPLTWFLLSLLLFAAAYWSWLYGEKRYYSTHPSAPAAAAHSSAKSAPPLTPAANKTQPPASYRLANTGATAGQLARNNHGIILRNALIDTAKAVRLNIPPHLRAKGAPGSYIVQSDRALDQEFYDELKKIGATNVAYIPNNAALVEASPEQAKAMVQDPEFQAVLPWEPYYKLDSTLLPAAVEQEPVSNALRVTTFPGQLDAAVTALTGLGARIVGQDSSPFGPSLVVQAPPDTLAAVAQLPLAWEVEAYTPRKALNDLTRAQIGVSANTLTNGANYLSLYGSNIWININDTGVDNTHPDLTGRVFGLQTDADGHGTHVAGSIAGSGLESGAVTNFVPGSVPGADFRGKAKQANLFVQGLDLVLGPFISDASLQSNASYALTTGAKTNGSIVTNGFISNNSWGYQGMLYDTPAASYDAAVRDAQPAAPGEQAMLFVFAAGNNGNGSGSGLGQEDTITSPATAKNVITVGAIDAGRFITNEVSYDGITSNEVFFSSTDNSNLVAYFSSCGNVGVGTEGEYGRFKPDVVAPGVFTVSCRASNYIDPSYLLTVGYFNYPSLIVKPGQSNIQEFFLSVDTSSLTIQVIPNSQSPRPFPPLLIRNGPANPPVGPAATNLQTSTTNLVPGNWYVEILNTNVQPVSYDLNIYAYQTNTEGDYYVVLSNMNNTLKPYYRYETGTSMAAGAVSGMLALMQQFLLQSFPSHPDPSPALLKAMLINGARSLGTIYDFNMQPNAGNEQGWGLVNLTNSLPASLTNGFPSMWFADQSPSTALSTGQSVSYTFPKNSDPNVTNNPVRVSLVWTDPPGNPAAGVALVNDLELTVTDGSGSNIYVGNDFRAGDIFTEASLVTNPAAGDMINNVQNVYLQPPIILPLTVTVTANRVNVNVVTAQTNQIAQDFALVVSSDDTALTVPLAPTTNGIIGLTSALVTVANSGVPLLHQRVGANEPNLYNYALGQTNGSLSQWHFFVFTNNQFSATNNATNVLFATFFPPDLSAPRNSDADIDLYVSTKPGLTNLNAAIIRAALKSLNRGGNEFIYLSNSTPGAVYYIGVKSEDQQASDFGFYSVAQQSPFSSANLQTGDVTYYGTPIPAAIPAGSSDFPGQVLVLVAFQGDFNVRKVSVLEGVAHPNPGDLVGSLTHPPSVLGDILNDHTSTILPDGATAPGFTNNYDDMPENPAVPVTPSDGPGSLQNFIGQPASGEWQLSEVQSVSGETGTVTAFDVTVSPAPPINGPIVIQLAANGGSYYNYVNVPDDALYLTNVVIFQSQGAGGPVGIFMTNENDVTTSDFGTNNIIPPGGYIVLGTNDIPPLSGGTWYYEIVNFGPTALTLTNYIYFLTSLTPNLVESLSNNTVTPLMTDGTTTSQICISNGQQVVALQVGLRIADTNLDDLSIHLISPQGTSVLLFEDRGGLLASNLGLSVSNEVATNIVYTVFTENTNLTTTPIKFAAPPYASTNAFTGLATNLVGVFSGAAPGTYVPGEVVAGWEVTSNEVSIVHDLATGYEGSNFLALAGGQIVQNIPTVPGASYELQYYVRAPQIADWWPGEDNGDDIVSTNNGTFTNMSFEAGEVGRAFTFTNSFGSYVAFSTNTGSFGTNNFTIDFWIETTSSQAMGVLYKQLFSCLANGWFMQTLANGEISFAIAQDAAGTFYTNLVSRTNINDGGFHEVAVSRVGLVLSLYVDGILDNSVTSTGIANLTNSALMQAGQDVNYVCPGLGAIVPFIGELDELDLWNRALSPAEVYAIYAAGNLGKHSTNSLYPNFQVTLNGISTNTVLVTNFDGGWQLMTNSFVATGNQVTVQIAGNPLGVLLANIQLLELPYTNYNNYYQAEESMSPFVGQNPQGCWTLQVTDTRNDASALTNGTLLSWNMQMTLSSTNVNLIVLSNGVVTNVLATNGMTYFAVDVPPTATFATNTLTVAGVNPLNLLFNQTALPTGTTPGDVTLLSGVTGPAQSATLSTQGAPPPLLPGQRYYLGVQNNSGANVRFKLEVSFDIATNQVTVLSNEVAITTNISPAAPEYYSFTVPPEATMVTFQVLNPANAQLGLFARDGLPLPGPLNYDYESLDAGTNDQIIVVTTNSLPVPLASGNLFTVLPPAPTTWYLSVYNFGGAANASYTIIATYVIDGHMVIIPLTDQIPHTNTAAAGFPTNLVYSFTVNNDPAGLEFIVTNLSGAGNVQLLSADGVYPTPQQFYYGSFNPGTAVQLVFIGTNAAMPSLNGIWYLAVPNPSSAVVKYSITADTLAGGAARTAPILFWPKTPPTNGFTIFWDSYVGVNYTVETSTDLLQWTPLSTNKAIGTPTYYTNLIPVDAVQARFFRLVSP